MSYPADIVAAAYAELAENRRVTAAETERNRARVYAAVPEIETLSRDLVRTSARLAGAILEGGDVEGRIGEIRQKNEEGQEKIRALLLENGFPADALADIHRCPLCGDTGVVPGGRVCPCVAETEKRLMRQRLEKSANCTGKDFTSFDVSLCSPESRPMMEKILGVCKEYAQNFTPSSSSLLMIGRPGLGKTHLSVAIGFAVIEKGYNVLYAPFHRLLGTLESARFSRNPEDPEAEYSRAMRGILDSELLILDDLGTEMTTAFTSSVLYEIINTRMVEGRPTIISTNLTESEITERYRERLYSRLFGAYIKLPFVGDDLRLKKR